MKLTVALLALLVVNTALAQLYPMYASYKMPETTSQIEREPTDLTYYYNKYTLIVEYEYDPQYQSFYKYRTYHYRVKLNTDAAIEDFNKIYISLEDVVAVKEAKARVIKKEKLVDVDIEMEEFYSEDEDEQYFYFPITGLELGDELEILYTTKMEPEFNGDQFYFQGEVPIYDFDFQFVVPNDSYFNFLAHNGLPEPTLIDTIVQRHHYSLYMDTIPALESERFSSYNNIIMKLDASLGASADDATDEYSPYNAYLVYAYYAFNKQMSGKDKKMARKLNKRIGVNPLNKEIDNIRKIENYMKNEFLIGYGEPDMSIKEMIKTGRGDGSGALLLFMRLLESANIPFEYGLVSDRYDTYFSSEIESNYFLQNYFFYFPDTDQYLAPLDFSTRVGFLDYQWIPNNGLYIKSKTYPNRSLDHEVKKLPATHYRSNDDSLIVTVEVDENMTDVEIYVERYISGYDAGEHQAYYYLYNENKQKNTQDDLLNFFNDNSKYKLTDLQNIGVEDAFVNPIIIKGKVTSLDIPIFEKAGDKIIFKLGGMFGSYTNPKDIEKKEHDFIFAHPFMGSTTIIVNFPTKVKVKNGNSITQSDDLSELPGIVIGSELTVNDNQIIYKQREEFQEYSFGIDQKEAMMTVFKFYSDLSKMNLIIEQ